MGEMKPGRIPCCVPFCKRSARNDGSEEVICGIHGRAIDRDVKRAFRQRSRRARPKGWKPPEACTPEERAEVVRHIRKADFLWAIMKRQAIERAMGLSGGPEGALTRPSKGLLE